MNSQATDTKRRLDATINMIRMCILEKGQDLIPRLMPTFEHAAQTGIMRSTKKESAGDKLVVEIANIANQGTDSPLQHEVVYAATVVILAELRYEQTLAKLDAEIQVAA